MIARHWSCRCPENRRDAFLIHLSRTGVAEARATPGYLGHLVCLGRHVPAAVLSPSGPNGQGLDAADQAGTTAIPARAGSMIAITLVTFWADEDAARAFAGPDPERAVLYEGDAAYGIEPDLLVRHATVVEADISGLIQSA